MGDKGYDSKANRQAARRRGAVPVIPYRSTAKSKPTFFPKALYKGRARIEQAVGKLKRFKRVALRCEKTKQNFASIVAIATGFILIKSVQTASRLCPAVARCANRTCKDKIEVKVRIGKVASDRRTLYMPWPQALPTSLSLQ